MEVPMYQRIKSFCSTQNRASGPDIDAENFFSYPVLQEDCIEHLTMVSRKEYSRYVSELLDRLGYSYDMIKYRQQMYGEMDPHYKLAGSLPFKLVTTGGKGEGTALYFESDIDQMIIIKDAICVDYPHQFIHVKNTTLFQTERQETSPGYTRLKLLRSEKLCSTEEIRRSLLSSKTHSYLSSQIFTDQIIKTGIMENKEGPQDLKFKVKDKSGPSTPCSYIHKNYDHVNCFRCVCPDILERWVSRPRCHGWPSPNTIQEISHLDGHVVPVGFKGSEYKDIEWRICYSLAELHLMQILNETQLKVYIILKKISKSVLNPVCADITSYIMKNVLFWMCEANGVNRFTKDLLIDTLLDCIELLRTCVIEDSLPSYMIPERNLFAGRLDIQQRQELTNLLGDLLHEGGRMLPRCDTLRDAMLVMYKTPDMFREFGEKRDKVERLKLKEDKVAVKQMRPEMSSEELARLQAKFCDINLKIRQSIQLAPYQMWRTVDEFRDLYETRLFPLLS